MKRLRLRFRAFALVLALSACADQGDEVVPIDEIPGDKLLAELTAAEFTGLCDWSADIANERLTPKTSCDGVRVQFRGCMRVNERCTATVDDWRGCLPDMVDELAEDPCASLEVRSAETFAAFIEAIPSCRGIGHCANTIE